jgi:hypothetical protein
MKLPEAPSNLYGTLDPDAIKRALRSGWDDVSALQIVVQDTERAEAYATSKQWVLHWISASTLYQSPYVERYWEGTMVPKASINLFTLAQTVNSLTPAIVNGLFYEDPPFIIQERAGTSADAAEAISDVLGFQLEDVNFRESIRLGVLNCLIFGTNIWKYGWEIFTETRPKFKRVNATLTLPGATPAFPDIKIDPEEEEIEIEDEEYQVDRPYFENIPNIRQVLVDPTLNNPDIRKAKYVVHRQYLTFWELNDLRERPGYKVPSEDQLIALFTPPVEDPAPAMNETGFQDPMWNIKSEPRFSKPSIDPFSQPLEVLEYWNNEHCISVLQKKWMLYNGDNPYREIPFLSVNWWDVTDSFYGIGAGKVVGGEQRLQQGVINQWVDQVTLALNGVYKRKRGKSVPTQSIRISPGRVVDVDDKDDITILERPPVVPEAGQHLALSQARVDAASGAGESSTGVGGSSAHSNLARTATGASQLGAGAGNRNADFVDKLANQVIVPFLYKMHSLNSQLLPASRFKYILNDELKSKYFQTGDVYSLRDAKVLFKVLAGSKMVARRNMAQAFPILSQMLLNPELSEQLAVQQLVVDVPQVLKMAFEVAEWRNYYDVVRPMNEDEKQRSAQRSPAVAMQAKQQAQFQQQQAIETQKANAKQQQSEDNNMARAAMEVMRHSFETAATPEAVTGEPGGPGFGSNI